MTIDILSLYDKSAKELVDIKKSLCAQLRFEDASFVADYVQYCMNVKRVVKSIINN